MSLWKRTLLGLSVVLVAVGLAAFGAMLPAGIIPPLSTVLALLVIPVVVVGGSSVLSIRYRRSADARVGRRSRPERLPMGNARPT
jgi:hypothetical protein